VVDIKSQAGKIGNILASSPSYSLTKLSHIFLPSNDELYLIAYVLAGP